MTKNRKKEISSEINYLLKYLFKREVYLLVCFDSFIYVC
jgi:hypothetical protein